MQCWLSTPCSVCIISLLTSVPVYYCLFFLLIFLLLNVVHGNLVCGGGLRFHIANGLLISGPRLLDWLPCQLSGRDQYLAFALPGLVAIVGVSRCMMAQLSLIMWRSLPTVCWFACVWLWIGMMYVNPFF